MIIYKNDFHYFNGIYSIIYHNGERIVLLWYAVHRGSTLYCVCCYLRPLVFIFVFLSNFRRTRHPSSFTEVADNFFSVARINTVHRISNINCYLRITNSGCGSCESIALPSKICIQSRSINLFVQEMAEWISWKEDYITDTVKSVLVSDWYANNITRVWWFQ